jgi:hypothetical protein
VLARQVLAGEHWLAADNYGKDKCLGNDQRRFAQKVADEQKAPTFPKRRNAERSH